MPKKKKKIVESLFLVQYEEWTSILLFQGISICNNKMVMMLD